MTKKRTAFVTGITGQDGSYLAELLLDKGYQVVGLARRSTHYHYENIEHLTGRIILEYGDLIDPDSIERGQPRCTTWQRNRCRPIVGSSQS